MSERVTANVSGIEYEWDAEMGWDEELGGMAGTAFFGIRRLPPPLGLPGHGGWRAFALAQQAEGRKGTTNDWNVDLRANLGAAGFEKVAGYAAGAG